MAEGEQRKIERNFLLPKDFEEKSQELGGKCVKESTFVDTYYDTSDFKLTLANYWLRSRADVYELKFPTGGSETDYASQYKESKEDDVIIKQLCLLLKLNRDSVSSVKELATQNLETFATIETKRKVYEMDNCTISVDIADFGLDLGVISVSQEKDETIIQATERINTLAKKLGCTSFADLDMNSLVKDSIPNLSLEEHLAEDEASGGDSVKTTKDKRREITDLSDIDL